MRRPAALALVALAGCGQDGDGSLGDSTVRHPAGERTPPEAIVRVEPTAAGRPAEAVSPDEAPPEPVALAGPVMRATGIARDPDGGVLRVRLTLSARARCRDDRTGEVTVRPLLRRDPPAAIERLYVQPGTRLRRELVRRMRVDLARAGCGRAARAVEVAGEIEADATNGRELEASAPLRFAYRP